MSPTPPTPAAIPQPDPALPPGPGAVALPPQLSLTDFIDLRTLQQLQDSFTAVTRMSATIRGADGRQLTAPSDSPGSVEGFNALDWLVTEGADLDNAGPLAAPIALGGQQLGSIRIEGHCGTCGSPVGRGRLRRLAATLGVPGDRLDELVAAAAEACAPNRGAAVQFLYLLANSIARLCYQEYQLRSRVEHLSALYRLSTSLAAQRDVQRLLESAARSIAEALSAKATFIRLLDDNGTELTPRCAFNLSAAYLGKGPVLLADHPLYQQARAGAVVYIEDMTRDPRVVYPEQAAAEGLASALFAGVVYQGRFIGAIQVYSATPRRFSADEEDLLRASAQLLATAISTASLDLKRQESERTQRQLRLAADVQKRMMPQQLPKLPPFDIAARYIPSLELSGDFYDAIDLHGNLGLAVADVAGKGVPASLLMASVRSSLRAFAQDVYDIDEIMARVNVALSRDTLDNEFATLFYGVLDPKSKRLTYCNAGHEPPLLLRSGKFTRLEVGGMVVGIDPAQRYRRDILDLLPGDLLLLYTDGLTDAQNFSQEKFGRERIMKAMTDAADLSAADALNHILWEMRRFSGLNRGIDDTTLVVVKYKK